MLNASAAKEYFGDFDDFFDRLEDPRGDALGGDVAGLKGGGKVRVSERGWGG